MITLYHPYSVSPLQAEYDTVTPKTKTKSIKQKQSGFCAKPYLYKHNILHLFTLWQCFSSYLNDMVHLSGQCEELSPSHNAKKTTVCQAKVCNCKCQSHLFSVHFSQSNSITITAQIVIVIFWKICFAWSQL